MRAKAIIVWCSVFSILFVGLYAPNSTVNPDFAEIESSPNLSSSRAFELSWTSAKNPDPSPLKSGDTVTGDQIEVHAIFPDIDERPDLDVVNISGDFSEGSYLSLQGDLIATFSDYEPYFDTIMLEAFAWVRIDDIKYGQFVELELNWANHAEIDGNCEVMAWWVDTDNTTWTYNNNVIGRQMCTEDIPEKGKFYASRSGSLMIGIFDVSGFGGAYTLIFDTRNTSYSYRHFIYGNEVTISIWDTLPRNTLSVSQRCCHAPG